jgi:hypothetical protein
MMVDKLWHTALDVSADSLRISVYDIEFAHAIGGDSDHEDYLRNIYV